MTGTRRRGPGERGREKARRPTRACPGVRRVLGGGDREGLWRCPSRRRWRSDRRDREIQKNSPVLFAGREESFSHEWKYLVTSEGSFIEQVYYCSFCFREAPARTDPGEDPQLRRLGVPVTNSS